MAAEITFAQCALCAGGITGNGAGRRNSGNIIDCCVFAEIEYGVFTFQSIVTVFDRNSVPFRFGTGVMDGQL